MKIGPLITFAAYGVAGFFPVIAMLVNEMVKADSGSTTLFKAKTIYKWKSYQLTWEQDGSTTEFAVTDYDCSADGYKKICDGGKVWFSFSLFEVCTVVVSLLFICCQQKFPGFRFLNYLVTLGGILCGIIAVAVFFKVGYEDGIKNVSPYKFSGEFTVRASPVLSVIALIAHFVAFILLCATSKKSDD